jgi:CBS domain containing-hemolysin-like protein
MDVFILAGLILLNGLFAMSEIALITSKKAKLQKAADSGDSSAQKALELGADPNRFLSTVQVGITSIGVLSGIVGESALAGPLSLWFEGLGVDPEYASYLGTGVVVVVITYFSIVLGELVPKRLGPYCKAHCWPCSFDSAVRQATFWIDEVRAPNPGGEGAESVRGYRGRDSGGTCGRH